MHDRIEKRIELQAPVARLWRALSEHREFGAWFGVKLQGPFAVGGEAVGQITNRGYEHVTWHAVVQKIDPERLLSSRGTRMRSIPRSTIRTRHPRSWSLACSPRRLAPCSS